MLLPTAVQKETKGTNGHQEDKTFKYAQAEK